MPGPAAMVSSTSVGGGGLEPHPETAAHRKSPSNRTYRADRIPIPQRFYITIGGKAQWLNEGGPTDAVNHKCNRIQIKLSGILCESEVSIERRGRLAKKTAGQDENLVNFRRVLDPRFLHRRLGRRRCDRDGQRAGDGQMRVRPFRRSRQVPALRPRRR